MPSRTPLDPLAERYGHRRRAQRPWYRRPLPLAAAVLGALLVLAYGVWVSVAQSRGPAFTGIGYRVLDDRTAEVTFAVTREPGTAVTCAVHALDAASAEVGLVQVRVPPAGERTVQLTVPVRTTTRATTALVESCSAVEG
ncbi:DUF4307 domain-containing protein [Kineococcus gypseus]|uniref:DUF4307 domain-containing protein n=1 Tax=Kineococcus gypseus TaxID=1637102 RepID=UPI003D7C3D96